MSRRLLHHVSIDIFIMLLAAETYNTRDIIMTHALQDTRRLSKPGAAARMCCDREPMDPCRSHVPCGGSLPGATVKVCRRAYGPFPATRNIAPPKECIDPIRSRKLLAQLEQRSERECEHMLATRLKRSSDPVPIVDPYFGHMQAVYPAAVSTNAEKRGGALEMHRGYVVKKFNGNSTSPSSGLRGSEAYHVEKLALCRLEAFASPCAGRRHYFPRLLGWNDSTLTLNLTNNGAPLALGIADEHINFTFDEIFAEAQMLEVQLACIQEQLSRAHTIHFDIACKNILLIPN